MKNLVGIDLGGTKIEVAILNPLGQVIHRLRKPTPQGDYDAVTNTVANMVRSCCNTLGMSLPAVIGMGIPGTLDPKTECVRGANSQLLNGRHLKHDLETLLGCEVRMANDANCLAVSEATDGAAAGAEIVFAVILGTGCGAGWFIRQHVWEGQHSMAGEWGHNPLPWMSKLEWPGLPCWCGQLGCLETWISGPAWAADHLRASGQEMQPPDIVVAMRRGEVQALQSFSRFSDRLARAVAQVLNLMDPDVVVLGGGLSQMAELYTVLPALIENHTFTRPIRTRVLPALHGDASGVRGAAWLSR